MSEAFAGGSRDPNHRPCRVAPLEAFSDELAPDGLAGWVQPYHLPATGRESSMMRAVFLSNCAGYKRPPRHGELYEAMRRTVPTARDLEVMRTWVVEATERQWFLLDRAGLQLADARPRGRPHGLALLGTHPTAEHVREADGPRTSGVAAGAMTRNAPKRLELPEPADRRRRS